MSHLTMYVVIKPVEVLLSYSISFSVGWVCDCIPALCNFFLFFPLGLLTVFALKSEAGMQVNIYLAMCLSCFFVPCKKR